MCRNYMPKEPKNSALLSANDKQERGYYSTSILKPCNYKMVSDVHLISFGEKKMVPAQNETVNVAIYAGVYMKVSWRKWTKPFHIITIYREILDM